MNRSRATKKPGGNGETNRKNRQTRHKEDEGDSIDEEENAVKLEETEKETGFVRPFCVKTSEVMGRYLVATKDFLAGEMILNEEALAVGPCQESNPICLICYRSLIPNKNHFATTPDPVPCEKCGWPLCGFESCIRTRKDGETVHDHTEECKVFAAARKDEVDQDPLGDHTLYEAIVPLRCLLLKHRAPERWDEICQMESHDAIRKTLPNIWNVNQEKVVDRIRGSWRLGGMFTYEEVHRVCGVLEVNAFEVGHNGSALRALIGPYACVIAHDCVPNTNHVDVFEPRSEEKCHEGMMTESGIFRLKVRCSTPISSGDTLYLSYAYTLQGTMVRREHLKESKFFSCTCRRCKDPTELGTFFSALRCPLCDSVGSQGRVLSKDPLDEDAEWRCDTCGRYTLDSSSVRAILERISTEADSISSEDVRANEAFLQRYRNVLYPSHYLAVGIKHSLSQLYGKVAGFTIHELPQSLLERKRDLCRELLQVFNVIEPGISKLRGVTLYELHAPLMTIITRNLDEGKLSPKEKKELKKKILEVYQCLEEAKEILQYEPTTSGEGLMAVAASEGLMGLKKWLSTLT